MTERDAHRASRRDFVTRAAMAFAGAGSTLAMWPLLAQMGPNRATPSPETVDVDLQGIPPGSMKVVRWRGLPVFVRHRTPAEVEEARATALADLPDQLARNAMLPQTALAFDTNRSKEGHEEWLVVTGLCVNWSANGYVQRSLVLSMSRGPLRRVRPSPRRPRAHQSTGAAPSVRPLGQPENWLGRSANHKKFRLTTR
jgi:ubiquinol-cytochrome c reductase iron-sulfur subunit